MLPLKGLIIKKKWLDLILSGEKTWEIRGCNTSIRGLVALIESGSGEIKGFTYLINSYKLTNDELKGNLDKHKISDTSIVKYKNIYAWEFSNTKKLEKPIKYNHPQGAVIWVNLENRLVV